MARFSHSLVTSQWLLPGAGLLRLLIGSMYTNLINNLGRIIEGFPPLRPASHTVMYDDVCYYVELYSHPISQASLNEWEVGLLVALMSSKY